MKKLALILAMACFVLTLSFALDEEFKPALAVSGSAKATLNYNLDTTVFSLKNDFDTDITFTFLAEKSEEKTGEGTYGYIKLKDVKFTFDSDDAAFTVNEAKVIAKIVSGPFFVQIMDESNKTKTIDVGGFGFPNLSDGKFLSPMFNKVKLVSKAGGYLYAGYDSEMIDFTVKVVNSNDNCLPKADAANQDPTETTADEDPEQIWFFAPSAAVTVSGATVKAGLIMSTYKGDVLPAADGALSVATYTDFTTNFLNNPRIYKMGIGASAEYSLALNDKINLIPSVGFDMLTPQKWLSDADFGNVMAIGGGVFAKWGGKDKYKPYISSKLDAAFKPGCVSGFSMDGDDVEFQGGAGVAVQYVDLGFPAAANVDPIINLLAQVIEQRGDDGLVPGLGAALDVEITNLTAANDLKMGTIVGVYANYKIGDITPEVRAKYYNDNGYDALRLGMKVDVANILPNTAAFVEYNSWNVFANDFNKGNVSGGVKITF